MSRIKQEHEVVCDFCGTESTIINVTTQVFDFTVGYGPNGPYDSFTEKDGTVRCFECRNES